MGDTKELKKIKKIYGEKFKNLCRTLFPDIIEQEGKLLEILEKRFSHNCDSLYEVITEDGLVEDFKELVFSEFAPTREEEKEEEKRTPYEILEKQGYDLIECKSEEDIQKFRKYYAPGELICTIRDGGRLATRDCFFAVRKDVDKIRREDFENPYKSDEYSTSVLAIQFTRDRISRVQIISRYNHTVYNPNCTLDNNLNRLAPGLRKSFVNLLRREIALTTENKKGFEMPGYTLASDGRYYKYNMEIDGEYFCPGNIVISNREARSIGDPEKGLLIDHFYIDFQNKTIKDMRYNADFHKDTFVDAFENIEKIEVERTEGANKKIKVYIPNQEKPIEIEVDRDNQIVGYINHDVRRVGDQFLRNNKKIEKIEIPKLEEVGDCFLFLNSELRQLKAPNLRRVGDRFLGFNEKIDEVEIPNLEEVGSSFLQNNRGLEEIKAPSLRSAGGYFLHENGKLEEIEIPNLEEVGDEFLYSNRELRQLKAPNLRSAGGYFLHENGKLEEIEIPNLEEVGDEFLYSNRELRQLKAPNLRRVGDGFLGFNEKIDEVEIPNLEEVGDSFLYSNRKLRQLKAPNLRSAGRYFLHENGKLEEIEILNLEEVGDEFLYSNRELRQLKAPNLRRVGNGFLGFNEKIDEVEIPNLEEVGSSFLPYNRGLEEIKAPSLRSAGRYFLHENRKLEEIEIPNLEEVGDGFLSRNRELRQIKAPSLRSAGVGFLSNNKKLEEIEIPNLPEVEKKLMEVRGRDITAEKTTEESEKKTIIQRIMSKMKLFSDQLKEIRRLSQKREHQILRNSKQEEIDL